MDKIRNYKDLKVWQKGIKLVTEIYKITKNFPDDEKFGLVNQMRRNAVSIPSNTAEGRERGHTNEFIRFLYISLGSCAELETQLVISNKLGYIDSKIYDRLSEMLNYITRMISNLIKSLKNRSGNVSLNPIHGARK